MTEATDKASPSTRMSMPQLFGDANHPQARHLQENTTGESLIAKRFRGYLPVVIDVETGGFNAKTDALLEVAAVILEMTSEGRLQAAESIIRHVIPFAGGNLEAAALAFTGIDPYDPARQAVPEKDAVNDIFQPIRHALKANGCKRAILVGHNATFDQAFLFAAAERANIKRNPFHPFSTFDTAALAGLAYGHTVLARACKLAGLDFDNAQAHSALYDAEKTADLFCSIVNRWLDLGGWPLASDDASEE